MATKMQTHLPWKLSITLLAVFLLAIAPPADHPVEVLLIYDESEPMALFAVS